MSVQGFFQFLHTAICIELSEEIKYLSAAQAGKKK